MISMIRWLEIHGASLVISTGFFIALRLLFAAVGLGLGPTFVVAIAMVVAFSFAKRRIEERLLRRIAAADGQLWTVSINNVDVGSISDKEYASLQLQSLNDRRVHMAQFGNLVRVAFNIVAFCVRTVPQLVFWVVVGFLVFGPEPSAIELSQLRTLTAQDIESVRAGLTSFVVPSLVLCFMSGLVVGNRYGFVNCFSADLGRRLRQRCRVAAEGDVCLYAMSNIDCAVSQR